jgi:hypothetical protein
LTLFCIFSYLAHVDSNKNKQLLWVLKSEFLDCLLAYLKGIFLVFEIANTGCHKYTRGQRQSFSATYGSGRLTSLNDVVFKDALKVVKKSLGCVPIPTPHDDDLNFESVLHMEKIMFVNGSNVFQSYFILCVLKQSYDDHANFFS